jgi:hypothetical protein
MYERKAWCSISRDSSRHCQTWAAVRTGGEAVGEEVEVEVEVEGVEEEEEEAVMATQRRSASARARAGGWAGMMRMPRQVGLERGGEMGGGGGGERERS